MAVAVESDGVEISVVGLPLEQSEAAASVEPALEQLKRLIQELKEQAPQSAQQVTKSNLIWEISLLFSAA